MSQKSSLMKIPQCVPKALTSDTSCCGYKPVSATASMNEEATAKKLF